MNITGKIKVVIADSQMLTREGVVSILKSHDRFDIMAIIESKDVLFDFLESEMPDLLIIDPDQLQDFLLIHTIKLAEICPTSHILVITSNTSKDFIVKILEFGITHLILKNSSKEEFLTALNAIDKNEKYLCKEAVDILLKENYAKNKIKEKESYLTKKEIEIVKLIAGGLTTKEIASRLFLSIHTVNTHRKNILRKLKINNTSELIMHAIRAGIIDNLDYNI